MGRTTRGSKKTKWAKIAKCSKDSAVRDINDLIDKGSLQTDVKQCQKKLSKQFQWASFGVEGKRILKIPEGVDMANEMKCLERWCNYIEKNVQFPVKAEVDESEDNWIIKEKDKVIVRNLNHIVDMYGIIAGINKGREKYD